MMVNKYLKKTFLKRCASYSYLDFKLKVCTNSHAVVTTLASQKDVLVFVCSPYDCVGFHPQEATADLKLAVGMNVSTNGCLCLCVRPVRDQWAFLYPAFCSRTVVIGSSPHTKLNRISSKENGSMISVQRRNYLGSRAALVLQNSFIQNKSLPWCWVWVSLWGSVISQRPFDASLCNTTVVYRCGCSSSISSVRALHSPCFSTTRFSTAAPETWQEKLKSVNLNIFY